MDADKLKQVLEGHKDWLNTNGEEGKKADLSKADLSWADLSGANLRGADLSGADLRGADLRGADLLGANLRGADLSGDIVRLTDLSRADLSGADLRRASLWGCVGNKKQIKSMQIERYDITYTKDVLQIGCEGHNFDDWINFSDEEISRMDGGALEWWLKWRDAIFSIIEMSPAED